MSFRRLSFRLNRVAGRLERGIEQVVGNVTSEIGREVVPDTPVDTGLARANWRPSLNVPATRPVTFTDPTGAATVARITAVGRSFRLGGTVYIVNRVPYIGELNAGKSPQAGPNFVQRAVRRGANQGVASFTGLVG